MKLCYDARVHPNSSLLYPGLKGFYGPALCAYNNSVFSDEDFAGIKRVGDSQKQASRGKVGRFGVGFNSVCKLETIVPPRNSQYFFSDHLTDVPSFISGNHMVIFDPHVVNLQAMDTGIRLCFTQGY